MLALPNITFYLHITNIYMVTLPSRHFAFPSGNYGKKLAKGSEERSIYLIICSGQKLSMFTPQSSLWLSSLFRTMECGEDLSLTKWWRLNILSRFLRSAMVIGLGQNHMRSYISVPFMGKGFCTVTSKHMNAWNGLEDRVRYNSNK